MLDGHHVVYVVRVPTKRIMTVAISVGTRFPAYATSMGRVLLAAPERRTNSTATWPRPTFEPLTDRTVTDPGPAPGDHAATSREQGYAIVDQELEEGLRAVAAPIRGAADVGLPPRSTSPPTPAGSAWPHCAADILPSLLETARQIETDLQAQGPGREH